MSGLFAAVHVVVLIGANDPDDKFAPATRASEAREEEAAMSRAAEEALGDRAQVELRRVPTMPVDADAVQLMNGARADELVEVAWSADRSVAKLHVFTARGERWVDREIRFSAADASAERGRTIGFAFASMLPEEPPPPPPSAAATETSPPPRPPPAPDVNGSPSQRTWKGAIDVAGVMASTLGTGFSAGGTVGGSGYLTRHFGVHSAAALREGEIESAEATLVFIDLGLGLAWRAGDPTRNNPLGLSAHADALLTRQAISHLSRLNNQSENQSRWIPGAELVFEGTWAFTDGAAFLLGAGAQAAFGTTDVLLRGDKVAIVAPLSLVARAGIRASF